MIAIALGVARLRSSPARRDPARAAAPGPARRPVTYAPSMSVIVPAYNEGSVIVKTIESLVSRITGPTLEVVVVDDGSPDDT